MFPKYISNTTSFEGNLLALSLLVGGALKGVVEPCFFFFLCLLTGHLEGSSISFQDILFHCVLPGPRPIATEANGLKLQKPWALTWLSQPFCHSD